MTFPRPNHPTTLTRRVFLTRAGMASVVAPLLAAGRDAHAQSAAASQPGRAARVFAAGPPAAVLVYALVPGALIGWPSRLEDESLAMLGAPASTLPVVGRLAGRGSTVSLEALMQARPDMVIDVGTVGPTYTSQAERVREQTGLRYELLSGKLDDSAQLLRQAGALLGVQDRAGHLAQVAQRILDAVARGRSRRARTRVYLARGADGLETGTRGSINTEVIEFVGAHNVADAEGRGSVTRVSLEQVLAWDPDVIVTQDPAFALAVARDATWRTVTAVRTGRVLRAPTTPFGLLDGPPGINRLIGARWLEARLDGVAVGQALREDVRAFYELFYGIRASGAQLDRLLGNGV